MISCFAVLLAQSNRGDSLSESFRTHAGTGREDVLLGLLMVATLVAGLWATSRLLGLRRRRRGYHNPWQLFWALCKAHGLNWSDRSLLGRLARHHRLRDPARLFLEAQRWDEQSLGPAFALEFVRLRTLRKQIFDGAARSPALLVPAEHRRAVMVGLRVAMVGGVPRNDLRLACNSRPPHQRAAWRRHCCPVCPCRRWMCRRGRKPRKRNRRIT